MFRHIVLVKWRPEATDEERQEMLDAVDQLPEQVPEIIEARIGLNVGTGPSHYDMAAVFDFTDRDAFEHYIASEAHQAYVRGPANAVDQLAVVQHTW